MSNKFEDFAVGIEIVVQDLEGNDIVITGTEALSDDTMHMIIEDVAEYLNRENYHEQ